MRSDIEEKCKKAKACADYMATLSAYNKNKMISTVRDAVSLYEDDILSANREDVERCKDKPASFIDRLTLNKKRLAAVRDGVDKLISLADPIGEILDEWVTEKTNLKIRKVRTPLGVIGLIYEARPNVTVDAVCLALKTGNAVVLRGSKDAIATNKAIVRAVKAELTRNGFDDNVVQLIEDVSHEGAELFMKQREYVDVLLPRGSKEFIKSVVQKATIPVIETGAGNCHAYVEKSADLKKAVDIIVNGKVSRPSVCNALESLLIDKEVAEKYIVPILSELERHGVAVRGCPTTKKLFPAAQSLKESDLFAEYGNLIISVKVVDGIDEAIKHINKYGTHHSEVIITEDESAAEKFLKRVDSAAVYVNASTRFTDGCEFGFGAEMGISTQKLHARGPMGLAELTSYKYMIFGNGQIRE
ncbi:MAG: glutamate-5-semialdehyde dehydrogenase [Clostridia bacterium]|nr:glutamate-5-semialdehyde dehydrogenase [Clostridia bacterium]